MRGGGGNHDRERHLRAEQFERGLRRIYRSDSPGHKLDPVVGLAVAAEGKLAVYPVRGVVVGRSRHLREGHRLEVKRGVEFVHARNAAVIAKGILLGEQERRTGDKGGQSLQGLPSVGAAEFFEGAQAQNLITNLPGAVFVLF